MADGTRECPRCGGEIREAAAVCKFCGRVVGKLKRPKGITVLAILCGFGAAYTAFLTIFLGSRTEPPGPVLVVGGLFVVTLILCVRGVLKLQRRAAYILLGVNALLVALVVFPPNTSPSGLLCSFVSLAWLCSLSSYFYRKWDYFIR